MSPLSSPEWFRQEDRRRNHAKASADAGTGERHYDHDTVSSTELAELLGTETPTAADVKVVNGHAPRGAGTHSHVTVETFGNETRDSLASLSVETPPCINVPEVEEDIDSDLLGIDPVDLLDIEIPVSWPLADTVFSATDFEPPDFEETHVTVQDLDTEFVTEVTDEQRARQQAISFLRFIDELQPKHVDWMASIILARRWSSAQARVLELWHTGNSIRAIHLVFQLSEAWRDVDAFDQRLDHGDARFGWDVVCRPRLTWREAAKLVDFFGEDSTLDELIEYIEAECHVWRDSTTLSEQFPRFKNYLLQYRLAEECRRPSLGWYRILDPRDGRFFGGNVNPEYSLQCWEDRIAGLTDTASVDRHIYNGGSIAALLDVGASGPGWRDWED